LNLSSIISDPFKNLAKKEIENQSNTHFWMKWDLINYFLERGFEVYPFGVSTESTNSFSDFVTFYQNRVFNKVIG
jgi:hypothetical protein